MIDLAKYRLPIFFAIFVFVVSGTFAEVKFTQGYRIDFTSKRLKPTGLLVASSTPDGAQVWVNGELRTATNNTLSLEPGDYTIEIKKNGFSPWQKKVKIEKELVTQTSALLFPQLPDMKPLTVSGAQNPQLSPDGTKIVYGISLPESASQSAAVQGEAGLWVLDLTDFVFINRPPRQIIKSTTRDFARTKYSWSYDSKQILVEFETGEKYLLDPDQLNAQVNLTNVSNSIAKIYEAWTSEEKIREEAKLKKVPDQMKKILAESAQEIEFSPDGSKILYLATGSAQIPEELIPPVLAASTQTQARKIAPGKMYVYDIKEDKNFLIPFDGQINLTTPTPTPSPKTKNKKPTPTPTPSALEIKNLKLKIVEWFPTSSHLFWLSPSASSGQGGDKVITCEYDGTNVTTIYSGPLVSPFVFAAPSGNKLIVLTNINSDPEAKSNLYSVSLK